MYDGVLVKAVHFDWFFTTENGEECGSATVMDTWGNGQKVHPLQQAKRIIYHAPTGCESQHYADIFYMDGRHARVFNINEVDYFKEGEEIVDRD